MFHKNSDMSELKKLWLGWLPAIAFCFSCYWSLDLLLLGKFRKKNLFLKSKPGIRVCCKYGTIVLVVGN